MSSHPSDVTYPRDSPFPTHPYQQRQGTLFPNGINNSNNYNHSPAGPSNPNPSSIDIYDTSPRRRRRVPRTVVDDAIFGFVENTRRGGDEDDEGWEDIELSPSEAVGYRGRAVGAFAEDEQWDGLGISMRGGAWYLVEGGRFEGIERRDPDRLVVRNILYPPVSARGRNRVQRRRKRRKDPRLPRAWPESLEYIRFAIAKGILIIGAVLILMTIISGLGILTKLLKGEKRPGPIPVLNPDRVTEYKTSNPWTKGDARFSIDFYETLATRTARTGDRERFNIAPYSARGVGWPGEKEGRLTIDPYETKTKAPWTRGEDEKQKVERAADRFLIDPYEAKEKQTPSAERGEKFVIDPYEVRRVGWVDWIWGLWKTKRDGNKRVPEGRFAIDPYETSGVGEKRKREREIERAVQEGKFVIDPYEVRKAGWKGTRDEKGKMKEQEERFVMDPYEARGVGWG